jgi:hypothetical protein
MCPLLRSRLCRTSIYAGRLQWQMLRKFMFDSLMRCSTKPVRRYFATSQLDIDAVSSTRSGSARPGHLQGTSHRQSSLAGHVAADPSLWERERPPRSVMVGGQPSHRSASRSFDERVSNGKVTADWARKRMWLGLTAATKVGASPRSPSSAWLFDVGQQGRCRTTIWKDGTRQ